MRHPCITLVLSLVMAGLCMTPATAGTAIDTGLSPALTGDDAPDDPLVLAGLFDQLLDPDSKEGKILQGLGSVLAGAREVDYDTERNIGESLALEGFSRYGLPVENAALQKYVNTVGLAVARNAQRPTVPYRFVVVDSQLQNAFACPGGIIFVSRALIKTVENEAQLACLLAHEVAHVGHKHALKSIRRAKFLQGVGKITAATMKGDQGAQFE